MKKTLIQAFIDLQEALNELKTEILRPFIPIFEKIFAKLIKYQDKFLKANREARENRRGLWGMRDY